MVGFIGIVFIRFFLEQISLPSTSGIIASDSFTLIHYGLFYLAIACGFMYIVDVFTGQGRKVVPVVLFSLPLLWLAPILDIILTGGRGAVMTYIFALPGTLLLDLLTFFGPFASGITLGIRIEVVVILVLIGVYVYMYTQSVQKTIFSALTLYVFMFAMVSIPSILYFLYQITSLVFNRPLFPFAVIPFIVSLISQSTISHNIIHGTLLFVSQNRFLELGFDKLLSQISLIIAVFFLWLFVRRVYREKYLVIIGNSRPERFAHYTTLLVLGGVYAYVRGYGLSFSWVDILGIATLVLGWYGAWMFAVHVNDVADMDIDRISNPDRPLIRSGISAEEMNSIAYIWLTLSLLGSWSAGYYPFFMNLVFTASYYIYSVDFLRLKRIPIISSFLIGIACVTTVYAGFFFVSSDKVFRTFPIPYALGIIIFYTLWSNIRDMKDISGDRAVGIKTLPVLFGKNGPKVVGILSSIGYLLIPLFFSSYVFYMVAVPIAILNYMFVTAKKYQEKPIFVCLFALFFSGVLFYFL